MLYQIAFLAGRAQQLENGGNTVCTLDCLGCIPEYLKDACVVGVTGGRLVIDIRVGQAWHALPDYFICVPVLLRQGAKVAYEHFERRVEEKNSGPSTR